MTTLAMPATGAAFGEFGSTGSWKISEPSTEPAAGGSYWATTPLRNVDNSSIRDALAVFDSALLATNALLLFAAPGVSRTVEIMLEDGDVSLDWLYESDGSSLGHIVGQYYVEPPSFSTTVDGELEPADSLGERPAVTVIRQLQRSLGLPTRDLLRAARVSKSTFHSWDKPESPQPRLASQGRLWALAETVEDLAEHLGGLELVGPWIAAADERRSLLRAGDFDTLLKRATPAAAAGGGAPYLAGLYAAGEEKQLPLTSTAAAARQRKATNTTGTSRRRVRKVGGSA